MDRVAETFEKFPLVGKRVMGRFWLPNHPSVDHRWCRFLAWVSLSFGQCGNRHAMEGTPMDANLARRAAMAGLGAAGGLSLYGLGEILDRQLLSDRPILALASFVGVFFFALLAMAGPLRIGRAALSALGVALLTAALLTFASLRFDHAGDLLESPLPLLAALVLAAMPLPFVIAALGPFGWRDYPTLFSESWTIAVRYAAAGMFVIVFWGLIFLSDALLSIVGLRIIEHLLDQEAVPYLLTGAALGLGMAVVTELSDLVSPYLVLRLMRLLLPLVLVVMAVFVLALPVQGMSGLFGGLSVAATLLAMAGMAAMLVTVAVDQEDSEAIEPGWMTYATRALACLVAVFAGLAGWAVWLRVSQYGWTPPRVFGALASALSLAYGLAYLRAVLAGPNWMARLREGNVIMALVVIASAIAWLSVLDPYRLSARDQLARFEAGKTSLGKLDLAEMERWGRAGAAALARLEARAAEPGQEALARHLANRSASVAVEGDAAALREQLARLLPLRPVTAADTRDAILATVWPSLLPTLVESCLYLLEDGLPGCALVVADFWEDTSGPEAILLYRTGPGGLSALGFVAQDGTLRTQSVAELGSEGGAFAGAEFGGAEDLLRAAQSDAPRLAPLPRYGLGLGNRVLQILP
jgi:hypothetical protein